MKKNIGLITPGGDASGMNACIRSVVRSGIYYGYNILGIYRGYEGLLEENIHPLTLRSVSGIINHGGTILKSSRCKKIRTKEGIKNAINILKKHNINWLIIIGGDGSITAGEKISKLSDINVIGIPASIDNDVYGTDETIGFDTAIDVALECIDKIRDTATSFERVFIVEVMGREHGFLALSIGVASGAEFVILPEIKYDIKTICNKLKELNKTGKTSVIIIFAEGAGNPNLLAEQIVRNTSLEVRVSSLGYIQRGGSPSARSRILAAQFGNYAIELIRKGIKNCVVITKNGQIKHIPISLVVNKKKKLDLSLYKLLYRLSI